MVMRINVLLVEDDHALREALADTLLLAGHGFRAVSSGEEALAAVMVESSTSTTPGVASNAARTALATWRRPASSGP